MIISVSPCVICHCERSEAISVARSAERDCFVATLLAMTAQLLGSGERSEVKPTLSVEPDVLHAIAVEDAVDHDRQPLDIGLPAGRVAAVKDNRPGDILGELAFDCPDQLLTPFLVCLD